jgi:hypothetical protein
MPKVTITQDLDKQAWRDEYQTALDTLTQIRDASSLTNAQAVAAIKYMAKVLIIVLKVLARVV